MQNLTKAELTTLEAYDTSPSLWADAHADSDFWDVEFEAFRTFLPAGKIIDVGAGTGRDTHLFLTHSEYDYLGVDLSSKVLEEAQASHPTARFENHDLYNLNELGAVFDGLWCAAVLIHIPKKRAQEALTAMRSCMKAQAIGMIATKLGAGERLEPWPVNPEKSRLIVRYSHDELTEFLTASGFDILWENVVSKHGSNWQSFIVRNSADAN